MNMLNIIKNVSTAIKSITGSIIVYFIYKKIFITYY